VAAAGLTGILLVGGGSTRFGSPKALATFEGETLAARAWRLLGEVCDERIALGKQADALPVPFDVLDDQSTIQAPLAGIVAGLRAAEHDRCIVLPVDVPLVRAEHLRTLADAGGDAAVPQTGPLPGAYARSALPELARRLAKRELALRDALDALDTRVVDLDHFLLANVNTASDLALVSARARALTAAQRIADLHGLRGVAPRILQDWNDTIIHLRPTPVVARIRTSWVEGDAFETYERELAVAEYAAVRDAPVVPPTSELPPGPYAFDGIVVTLWTHVDELPGEIAPLEAGRALRALHDALADYPGSLPSLWERLEQAQRIADDAAASPALAEGDRRFLSDALRTLRRTLADFALPERALHGGPHESNLLRTPAGPRWIDLDTVCRGPLEWDLAHLPDEAAREFPDARADALAAARDLVSAEVALWCWHTYGRAPQVDEAAHFHLGRLRETV
jgi:molybdopterin-guanine dinucleotide biosynthesis protein A